jgi:hypothetical protein
MLMLSGKTQSGVSYAISTAQAIELVALWLVKAGREDDAMKPEQPYRWRHAGYVSDFDSFMQGYLERRPAVEKDQQHGWYLLWDKHVDQGEIAAAQRDNVPIKSYSYR